MSQFVTWSRKIVAGSRLPKRSPHQGWSAPRKGLRPQLEPMEHRTLLSTLTVMNNHDSGSGSLRAAIAVATSGDTINFSSKLKGETITLTSGPLTLGVNLTIDGLGANKLTVSGGGTEGVFVVSAGVTATIDNLTIASGLAVQGAGIDNFGSLTVSQCALTGNTAVGGSGDSTTPGAANGGGIANEVGASLTLTQSLLTNNVAAASPGDDSFAGGLLNLGSATIDVLQLHRQPGHRRRQLGLLLTAVRGGPSRVSDSRRANCTARRSRSPTARSPAIRLSAPSVRMAAPPAPSIWSSAWSRRSVNCQFTGNVATGATGCIAKGGAINTEGCYPDLDRKLIHPQSGLRRQWGLQLRRRPPPRCLRHHHQHQQLQLHRQPGHRRQRRV